MWAAVCGFAITSDSIHAQEPAKLKVGGAFNQQIQERVDFEWGDRPLRSGLERLTQAYGVAVFLDRRIDPDQPITISVHAQPLEDALRSIAKLAKSEIAQLGPAIYIGPPDAARD